MEQPGGSELILDNAGKDITKLFQKLHPKGTLQASLSSLDVVGQIDSAFPSEMAVTDNEENDIDERRDELPPLSTISNLATFERLAKYVLQADSTAWKYISSWSDDG